LSYEREKDIDVNISKFLKITGLINTIFKLSKVQKQTRIQIYNTLALPTLLYGSENCAMKANDKTRITAVEMRFLRTTAKYIWSNYKRSDDILKELKTEPLMEKVLKYKNNWIRYVNRKQRDRISKLLQNYKPRGRRNRGRPMKRLLDDGTGTGQ
jgi:hypothetical protein